MCVWNELLNKFISAFELLGVRMYVKLFWKSEVEKIKLGEYVRVRKRMCVSDSKAKRGRGNKGRIKGAELTYVLP